jgi:hypothetical protein
VAALEAHVSDRRDRIKDLLGELQRRVDEGLDGRIARWPSFDDARLLTDDLSAFDDEDERGFDDDFTGMVIEAQLASGPEADQQPAEEPGDEEADLQATVAHTVVDVTDDEELELEPALPSEWEPFDEGPAPVAAAAPPPDDEDEAAEQELVEVTPPAARGDFPAHDVDDETYFAQLRGALEDDSPLGPRDDLGGMLQWREEARTAVAEAPRLYDQGEPDTRKFGLRKRRQRRRD